MIGWLVLLAAAVLAYFALGEKPAATPQTQHSQSQAQRSSRASSNNSSKKRFYAIGDTYKTLEDVQKSLRANGLESSELIVGVTTAEQSTTTPKPVAETTADTFTVESAELPEPEPVPEQSNCAPVPAKPIATPPREPQATQLETAKRPSQSWLLSAVLGVVIAVLVMYFQYQRS